MGFTDGDLQKGYLVPFGLAARHLLGQSNMARKKLIRSDVYPYHVTCRTNNREPFPIALEEVWRILESECMALWMLYGVEFHSVVLMPNHIHMILTVPNEDLGKITNILFKDFSRRINSKAGRTGHILGGSYFWSIITSSRYYGHALKYVYRNPVKAGLSQKVEEYPFSTAHGLVGNAHLSFPLHYTRVGMEIDIPEPDQHFEWLGWLNTPFSTEAEDLIRLCLRKKEIKILINRTNRVPNEILQQLL
jgi:putative transposase